MYRYMVHVQYFVTAGVERRVDRIMATKNLSHTGWWGWAKLERKRVEVMRVERNRGVHRMTCLRLFCCCLD